jgi:hypothetical protein
MGRDLIAIADRRIPQTFQRTHVECDGRFGSTHSQQQAISEFNGICGMTLNEH